MKHLNAERYEDKKKKGYAEAMPIHEMSKYSKPNVSELQVH